MSTSLDSVRLNERLIAYTAAAMYGAGFLVDVTEALIPGGPTVSLAPGLAALGVVAFLLAVGPRLPRWALAPVGPIGAVLIAYAQATSPGPGDGAVLYMWPVLWTAFFFGRRGAVTIVGVIGIAHGLAILALPAASRFPDRWVDVMASVTIVAVVVQVLAHRNDQLLARLAGEARTDGLTGLLNRRGFEEYARLELAHARRERTSVALVVIDIDYFKRVNDEWGHDIGDLVLARVGRLLQAHSRDVDLVARAGGEEFVLLLPGCDAADADAALRRLREALLAPDPSGLPGVRVSAGIAAAVAPEGIGPLLERADSALYAAKQGGRDRTVIAESSGPVSLDLRPRIAS